MSGKVVKITIHMDDGEEITEEVDGAQFSVEAGIERTWEPGQLEPVGMKPNGQKRIIVKGWKGCRNYESFQSLTDDFGW